MSSRRHKDTGDRIEIVSRSAEETERIGMAVAVHLEAGDLVVLVGGLGTGKSVFIRGVARGLGVEGAIPSPTFVLMRDYPRWNFCHLDAYRLEDWSELMDLGLEDYLYGERICAIEWGDRVRHALPPDSLQVDISFNPAGENIRDLVMTAGEGWTVRWEEFRRELITL